MRGDEIFLDDSAAHEVLLDDSLEDRRIAAAIPCPFRVDDRDRSALANAQAVGFRSQDAALVGQPELPQPLLQKIPRRNTRRLVTALRRSLVGAQEDVTSPDRHAYPVRDLPFFFPRAIARRDPKSIDIMGSPLAGGP